ncbi:MAG: hypothetical protein WDO16_18075 [Bacteroidota bacterium]
MINDPYIEIINKTKSPGLNETLIEQSINKYLKDGADKTLSFLIHDNKIPESEAEKLVGEIKKEFKASYYAGALYAGIFMSLFLACSIILLMETEATNIWLYICLVIFIYCAYSVIRNLTRAFSIK